ncbi:hypothetical protein [Halpernia sp. GG3]
MADSFTKKEGIKKKIQKQKEKEMRREGRKESNDKGKSLDDMIHVCGRIWATYKYATRQERESGF